MNLEALSYAPATGALSSFWILILIPLASAAILLLLGRRADKWGHILGVASVGAAFKLAAPPATEFSLKVTSSGSGTGSVKCNGGECGK